MKAVWLIRHGGVEVLEYGEQPEPVPKPGEVLIRLKASALNALDLWVRRGWPGIKITYPFIPGADGAGEIVAIGSKVEIWERGDRVVINPNIGCGHCDQCAAGFDNRCRSWSMLGENRNGTYAQFVAVPDTNIYHIPDNFDEFSAAASALVYQTAWHSLVSCGKLRPGESVLIVGASGGVNTASIQIAKLVGATVFVVGSSQEKLSLAEECGADYLIDRSKNENWSTMIYRLTDKKGVDVIVDNVGTTFTQSFRAAAKGGRILTVGNTGGARFEIDNRFIFSKHLSIVGSTMSTKKDFAAVMDLIFEEKLRPVMYDMFPLADAATAQQRLENGQQMGKITLAIP